MQMIRVLIVDDHPVIRTGIRNLLLKASDIEVVGDTGNGNEALQMVKELAPEVLLLDMEISGLSGAQVAEELQKSGSPVRILVLSAHNDRQYIQGLLMNGAFGYLTKDEAPESIIEAVRGVARGEHGWISRQIAALIPDWTNDDNNRAGKLLTNREEQVLQQVVAGKTNREIGVILNISEKTVEKHLEAIYHKLGVLSRVEAAVWATRESKHGDSLAGNKS